MRLTLTGLLLLTKGAFADDCAFTVSVLDVAGVQCVPSAPCSGTYYASGLSQGVGACPNGANCALLPETPIMGCAAAGRSDLIYVNSDGTLTKDGKSVTLSGAPIDVQDSIPTAPSVSSTSNLNNPAVINPTTSVSSTVNSPTTSSLTNTPTISSPENHPADKIIDNNDNNNNNRNNDINISNGNNDDNTSNGNSSSVNNSDGKNGNNSNDDKNGNNDNRNGPFKGNGNNDTSGGYASNASSGSGLPLLQDSDGNLEDKSVMKITISPMSPDSNSSTRRPDSGDSPGSSLANQQSFNPGSILSDSTNTNDEKEDGGMGIASVLAICMGCVAVVAVAVGARLLRKGTEAEMVTPGISGVNDGYNNGVGGGGITPKENVLLL
ncbi:uncharacterized protein PHALS_06224 [Plasmopara halstedii]|uniref:RxLR-like protein n=1 Tax=Plasmopara halstedii TaxID=4781 RepID=A0A0P1B494_PLAHL|nr:uncharacterized protein PHALS_06224 [Plasmopara halstedii]CEG48399.1 hypothetical protein PHALS_06224 [Plasmopara halstedii]|eukprot:XP_024584768.1 hypothetical protein PHALS_06224 [Plasmopara halstedii]